MVRLMLRLRLRLRLGLPVVLCYDGVVLAKLLESFSGDFLQFLPHCLSLHTHMRDQR
jgi:hypothetical protein